MCRYAIATYKSHYACFNCRKTFKRRTLKDINGGVNKNETGAPAKCPECSQLMANMGLDFEAPKKSDIKAWEHIATLYDVGITFHACGCSGPGYIPSNSDELVKYFSRIKETYLEHRHFWARRHDDPESQSEIAKDEYKNQKFLYGIPLKMRTGTRKKSKYDSISAQKYWHEKVLEIEDKIKKIYLQQDR